MMMIAKLYTYIDVLDFGLFSMFLTIDSYNKRQIPKIQVSGERFRTISSTKHLGKSQNKTLNLLILKPNA